MAVIMWIYVNLCDLLVSFRLSLYEFIWIYVNLLVSFRLSLCEFIWIYVNLFRFIFPCTFVIFSVGTLSIICLSKYMPSSFWVLHFSDVVLLSLSLSIMIMKICRFLKVRNYGSRSEWQTYTSDYKSKLECQATVQG